VIDGKSTRNPCPTIEKLCGTEGCKMRFESVKFKLPVPKSKPVACCVKQRAIPLGGSGWG